LIEKGMRILTKIAESQQTTGNTTHDFYDLTMQGLLMEFSDMGDYIQPMLDHLALCEQPFGHSQLYEVETKTKKIDPELRKSTFRAITDVHMFDLASKFVEHLSSFDQERDYTIVRNDIQHIKYVQGGYFKAHEDFLSLTTNVLEEWTLLVNAQRPGSNVAEGGRTKLHLHNNERFVSKATTLPGCALAFRKDLQHEGELVTKNTKEILSMNIWVTKKTSNQILLIKFPAKKAPTLFELAKGTSSYALPLSEVMAHEHCPLAAFCEDSSAKVIEYLCEEATFEQFRLIFKIFRGQRVSAKEVQTGAHLLDFFGLNTSTVLVDVAERQLDEGIELMQKLDWANTTSALISIAQSTSATGVLLADDSGEEDIFYR
jgi:hypothetical protein